MVDVGIRLFICLFCILAVLVELELTSTVRGSMMCQSWPLRGIFYIFVGLLQAFVHEDGWADTTLVGIVITTSYGFLFGGVIYVFMGLLQVKRIHDEKMARYIQLISFMEVWMNIP